MGLNMHFSYHSNSFQRKDCSAEEKWKLMKGSEMRSVINTWKINEDIIEGNTNTSCHKEVGKHGEWCKPLEVTDHVEKNKW